MWFGSSPSCEKELPRRSRVFTLLGPENLLKTGFVQKGLLVFCGFLFGLVVFWASAKLEEKKKWLFFGQVCFPGGHHNLDMLDCVLVMLSFDSQ